MWALGGLCTLTLAGNTHMVINITPLSRDAARSTKRLSVLPGVYIYILAEGKRSSEMTIYTFGT